MPHFMYMYCVLKQNYTNIKFPVGITITYLKENHETKWLNHVFWSFSHWHHYKLTLFVLTAKQTNKNNNKTPIVSLLSLYKGIPPVPVMRKVFPSHEDILDHRKKDSTPIKAFPLCNEVKYLQVPRTGNFLAFRDLPNVHKLHSLNYVLFNSADFKEPYVLASGDLLTLMPRDWRPPTWVSAKFQPLWLL